MRILIFFKRTFVLKFSDRVTLHQIVIYYWLISRDRKILLVTWWRFWVVYIIHPNQSNLKSGVT
jgi:hypothetical protein